MAAMATVRTVAAVVTMLALVAVVALTRGGDEGAPSVRASSAVGSVQIGNSLEGRAILAARNMVPGSSARGTVTISNTGDAPGETRLEPTDLVDVPGARGAPLSHRLVLDVSDTSGRTVYRGALADQRPVALGAFEPGEARTYRFVATLPRASGNEYQRARAGVGFRWTMTGGGEAPAPPPAPAPPADVETPAPEEVAPSVGPRRLTVLVRRTRLGRTFSRGFIRLTVICSRPCRATMTGTARWGKGRNRVRKVKRARRTLPARATTVRIAVPSKLRRRKRFTLRVSVVAVASGGARAAVTRSFRLNKPRYQVLLETRAARRAARRRRQR